MDTLANQNSTLSKCLKIFLLFAKKNRHGNTARDVSTSVFCCCFLLVLLLCHQRGRLSLMAVFFCFPVQPVLALDVGEPALSEPRPVPPSSLLSFSLLAETWNNQAAVISLTCRIVIGGRGRLLIPYFFPSSCLIIADFSAPSLSLSLSFWSSSAQSRQCLPSFLRAVALVPFISHRERPTFFFSPSLSLTPSLFCRQRGEFMLETHCLFPIWVFSAVSLPAASALRAPDTVQVRPTWQEAELRRKAEFISCSCESYISTIPLCAVWQRQNDGCHLSCGLKEAVGKGIWILSGSVWTLLSGESLNGGVFQQGYE